MIELLVKNGANINAVNKNNHSVLILAIESGNFIRIRSLSEIVHKQNSCDAWCSHISMRLVIIAKHGLKFFLRVVANRV